MISDKKSVQDIVVLMWEKGIRHVVISPGSRNAPLTISLNNYQEFTCYTVVDERSAAYMALGIAQQLNEGVALICTSGTAGLNYGPAIAEAFYQKIPLFVVTSDRPLEYIDQGEGQSIRQQQMFAAHCKKSVQLLRDTGDKMSELYNARLINESINEMLDKPAGPVHLNLPLGEPLYNTIDFPKEFPNNVIQTPISKDIADAATQELTAGLNKADSILILCGSLQPNPALDEALSKWAKLEQVLVLTESTSNLSISDHVSCIDRLIVTMDEVENRAFTPDLLITVGDNIISKKIKFLLRSMGIDEHWHVGETRFVSDTFNHLSRSIEIAESTFFSSLLPENKDGSNYRNQWHKRNNDNKAAMDAYLKEAPFSDLTACGAVLAGIPSGAQIQMGNSSIVRYIQLFNSRSDCTYFSNRGTSGIDGSSSTALGASLVSKEPVYLFTGDLSFLYDSNAFWNEYLSSNLKIILFNNGGGGIFQIIDGPNNFPELKDSFETPQSMNFEKLSDFYNLDYYLATNTHNIEENLAKLHSSTGTSILEIRTPSDQNEGVLKQFFRTIKSLHHGE